MRTTACLTFLAAWPTGPSILLPQQAADALSDARTYEDHKGGVSHAESHAADLAPPIIDLLRGVASKG